MTEHTPGPWRHDGMRYGRINDSEGNKVAEVPSSDHPAVDGRHAANARLIAAAPELLKMVIRLECVCARLADEYVEPIVMFAVTEQARAAIAKATGEGVEV